MESDGIPWAEDARLVRDSTDSDSQFELLDLTPAVVFLVARNGMIVFANRQACTVFGYDREELIGRFFSELCRSGPTDKLTRNFETIFRDGIYKFTERMVAKDGKCNRFTVRVNGVHKFDRDLAICVLRNETSQSRQSRRDRISRISFDLTTDQICVLSTDGKIVEVNKNACDVLGFSRPEMIGQPYQAFNPGFDMGKLGETELQSPGKPITSFEGFHRGKNGSTIPVEVTVSAHELGEGIFYLVNARDISARRKTEVRLQLTQFTVDQCAVPIVWFARDGRIVYVNRDACQMLEYERDEFTRMSLSRIIPALAGNCLEQFITRLKADRKVNLNCQVMNRSGQAIPVEFVASYQQCGHRSVFCASIRDLTESNRNQAKIRDLLNQLTHMNRLSSMGELASIMAHELNQPLTCISTNAFMIERMMSGLQSEPAYRDLEQAELLESLCRDIGSEALHAGAIVHRLRGFVSHHPPEKEAADLTDVIGQALKLLEPQLTDLSVRLRVIPPANPVPVVVDPIQIQQIIVNLVKNSLESLEASGTRAPEIIIETTLDAEKFSHTVIRDNGSGIPMVIRDELFQPFASTKSDGMGLGLSICHSIAASHGGRLRFNPDHVDGAEFILTLPLSEVTP